MIRSRILISAAPGNSHPQRQMGCGSSSAAKVAPQSMTVERNGHLETEGKQINHPLSPGERGESCVHLSEPHASDME